MAIATPVQVRPNRHWFQYRLRTLLIFTALCGTVALFVCDPVLKARRQVQAARAVGGFGGQIYTCRGKPLLPSWLRWIGGSEISVSHVSFPRKSGDREFALVDQFPTLLSVLQSGSEVTNSGLEHVRWLTDLQFLNLSDSKIDDDGLQCLADLEKLQNLNLANTHVTAAGLEHLKGLKNLVHLDLSQDHIANSDTVGFQAILPGCLIIVR